MLVSRSVNLGRVEGRVEPVRGDVENPNTVEVDQEMRNRTLLIVGLEEDLVPVDLAQLRPPLRRREVHQALLWVG